jgi:hypothetical protein
MVVRNERRNDGADGLRLEDGCGITADPARDGRIVPMGKQGVRWRLRARSAKPEAFAQQLGIPIRPAWRGGERAEAMPAGTGASYD